MTLYNTDNWGIAMQYFEQGDYLENFDYIYPWVEHIGTNECDEINLQRHFEFYSSSEYFDHIIYSREKRKAIEGFVGSGNRIRRTLENNQLFVLAEQKLDTVLYESPIGFIREIWQLNIKVTWRGIKSYTEHSDGTVTVDKSPLIALCS